MLRWMITAGLCVCTAAWSQTPTTPEIPLTGRDVPELSQLDRVVSDTMAEEELSGAAIAIARNGKLIYARGFGWSDTNAGDPVEPGSLFRIASISKPLTAVTLMQLVEEGKLDLDERFLDVLREDKRWDGLDIGDPRLEGVTLRQVMQHTGGWDRGRSMDPMLGWGLRRIARNTDKDFPLTHDDVIRYTLAQPLDATPGLVHAYSNFGYCVLGRVLEVRGGTDYTSLVAQRLLAPFGLHDIHMGRSDASERLPGEVKYTSSGRRPNGFLVAGKKPNGWGPRVYGGFSMSLMDSHGGWVASAPDLVRLTTALRGRGAGPILSKKSMAEIVKPPDGPPGHDDNGDPRASYYGLGFSVRRVANGGYNLWHGGSLEGTSTLMISYADGIDMALLFNNRTDANGRAPADRVAALVRRELDRITDWPEGEPREAWPVSSPSPRGK